MEKLHLSNIGETSQQISHERSYVPPLGVSPEHFQGIQKSDFFIKKAESISRDYKNSILDACIDAIRATSMTFVQRDGRIENPCSIYFTAEQNEAHLQRYVASAIETIALLSQEKKHIAVVASPMGGLAPLHAVMKAVVKYHSLHAQVSFMPLQYTVPIQQQLQRADGYLLLDDGLGTATSQATLLFLIDDRPKEISDTVNLIKSNKGRVARCDDLSFSSFYRTLIKSFENHQAVILPLFTKNPLFMELLSYQSEKNTEAWGLAQGSVLNPKVIVPIPEDFITTGAMIDEYPCRDMGVDLLTMQQYGHIEPKILMQLENAGLKNAEFRLMADQKPLMALPEKSKRIVIEAFVQNLHNVLS